MHIDLVVGLVLRAELQVEGDVVDDEIDSDVESSILRGIGGRDDAQPGGANFVDLEERVLDSPGVIADLTWKIEKGMNGTGDLYGVVPASLQE